MKIGLILKDRKTAENSPLITSLSSRLSERGVEVGIICPEEGFTDQSQLRVEHDLYVLKYRSELSLSFAGALEALGARIINPYQISEVLRNKIVTTQILEKAGIPIPRTYIAGRPEQLSPLLSDGPLVVKPYRGAQGRDVRVIRSEEELTALPFDGGPVFAQDYRAPDGRDRKIYCIGDELFGVKRVWPAKTMAEKIGEPFSITGEIREITLRCGEALGIDVFGIDIVLSEGHPVVVDASSFPGFKGVPDAGRRLADYIIEAARRPLNNKSHLTKAEEVRI